MAVAHPTLWGHMVRQGKDHLMEEMLHVRARVTERLQAASPFGDEHIMLHGSWCGMGGPHWPPCQVCCSLRLT